MKTIKITIIAFLLMFVTGLNAQVPTSYGVYLSVSNLSVKLSPHKTHMIGNLVESISGLDKAVGKAYPSVEYIYSYLPDNPIAEIKLSKLSFSEGENIRNPFGQNTYTELNMYISKKVVTCTVTPVKGTANLYKVVPSEPLVNGFYAIHWGCLTSNFSSTKFDSQVYDFVVGQSINPYMSVVDKKAKEEETLLSISVKLLEKTNKCFNDKDYTTLRTMYQIEEEYDDEEWKRLTEGFANWYTMSGKILSYEIVEKDLEKDRAEFLMKTKYEILGIVNEFFIVEKEGDKYYVDFVGSD